MMMSVKAKTEYVSVVHERIGQEEVINYEVNYCEVNYYEYEHKQEVDYIQSRPCLIDSEDIVCELIEDREVEYGEIIEDREAELTEDQKVEDINMLK